MCTFFWSHSFNQIVDIEPIDMEDKDITITCSGDTAEGSGELYLNSNIVTCIKLLEVEAVSPSVTSLTSWPTAPSCERSWPAIRPPLCAGLPQENMYAYIYNKKKLQTANCWWICSCWCWFCCCWCRLCDTRVSDTTSSHKIESHMSERIHVTCTSILSSNRSSICHAVLLYMHI